MFQSLLLKMVPYPRYFEFLGKNFAWWTYFNWLESLRRAATKFHLEELNRLESLSLSLREARIRPK
jgi:hypothetical protein